VVSIEGKAPYYIFNNSYGAYLVLYDTSSDSGFDHFAVVKSRVPDGKRSGFDKFADNIAHFAPTAIVYNAKTGYTVPASNSANGFNPDYKVVDGKFITNNGAFGEWASDINAVSGVPNIEESAWETAANNGTNGLTVNNQVVPSGPDYRSWDSVSPSEKHDPAQWSSVSLLSDELAIRLAALESTRDTVRASIVTRRRKDERAYARGFLG
jgi:hypothetical protein